MWSPCEERSHEVRGTQLNTIREIMLAAGTRGAWLTLEEIAGLTEIGEASISAQLRHLRKPQYGRHRVEKRRRTPEQRADESRGEKHAGNLGELMKWEYRVLAPFAEMSAVVWDATRRGNTSGRSPQISAPTRATKDAQTME